MYFAQFSNGVDIGDLVVSGTKVDNVGSVRNPIQVFQAAIAYRQGAESMQFFSQNSEKKIRKKCILFQKIAILAFLVNCKMKKAFLSNYSSIY